jgi:serine/threonine-protein kinase RsbW
LDADNLLKPSGRGIFYIRTFMDEVEFRPLSQGGTEVHMVKKLSS